MNARDISFEMCMEGRHVDEVVASIFHTILFHRTSGKFTYSSEETYSIGTVSYVDVDCQFLDFTYVCCESETLGLIVNREIAAFSQLLCDSDGSPPHGTISLEFYTKERARWPFNPECFPWEIWTVGCELIESKNEREMRTRHENVVDMLNDKIVHVTDVINRYEYVPKAPRSSDVDLVYDTSFTDIQPYLFKIRYNLPGATPMSFGNVMRKLIRDTLFL